MGKSKTTRKRKARRLHPEGTRAFVLAADAEIARYCVGASPRVTINAGEVFSTPDERLASRLAADPLLEEVTEQ